MTIQQLLERSPSQVRLALDYFEANIAKNQERGDGSSRNFIANIARQRFGDCPTPYSRRRCRSMRTVDDIEHEFNLIMEDDDEGDDEEILEDYKFSRHHYASRRPKTGREEGAKCPNSAPQLSRRSTSRKLSNHVDTSKLSAAATIHLGGGGAPASSPGRKRNLLPWRQNRRQA